MTPASVKENEPLPFYTDELGFPGGFLMPMVHPFVKIPDIDRRDPDKFKAYYEIAPSLFKRVTRDDAAVAVLPWDWHGVCENPKLRGPARQFIRDNARAGLKTLLFSVSDPETLPYEPETILFCTSLLGRQRCPHEHAMPSWGFFEPDVTSATLPLCKFTEKPTVGFCGASYRKTFREPNWFRRTFRPQRCQYERVYRKAPGLRAHLVDELAAMLDIKSNILERDSFLAGAVQNGKFNFDSHAITRREFINNLIDSDYALCVRGGGNFSFRLYETLQLGRIPLFINTDCVLPWAESIPWKELCVWVELDEIDNLRDILLARHRALGPAGFEKLQRRCRAVWEKFLSPEGFFTTLRAQLTTSLRSSQHVKI